MNRTVVSISSDDAQAALQILAFLAYPHRPEFAIGVLRGWAQHRSNIRDGERRFAPDEKWSRLEPKLLNLEDKLIRHLKGANWLRLRIQKAVPFPGADFAFHSELKLTVSGLAGRSVREAARAKAGVDTNTTTADNARRAMWVTTRRVAHMGLATGDAIMRRTRNTLLFPGTDKERVERQWDFVRTAFKPDWVSQALLDAEHNAEAADRFGIIPLEQAMLFRRDNF